MTKKNIIDFSGISPFKFTINYVEIDSVSHLNINDSHIHEECEIYINLSGDVSFMVEDKVYPISAGDIIITRPNELHHCIYRSNALHKHFWILLSSQGNEQLLDIFFNRSGGSGNLISPSAENSNQINLICNRLVEISQNGDMENDTFSKLQCYKLFFELLALISSSASNTTLPSKYSLPEEVSMVLDYLQENFTSPVKITDLAALAHVSVNTLERRFSETLLVTPNEYLRRKRLAYAKELLRGGTSVQEACEKCGFSDYSHFIASFKRHFGITPLKYQKSSHKI